MSYWPVLLPNPNTLPALQSIASHLDPTYLDTPHHLEIAEAMDIAAWLTIRRREYAASNPDFRAALAQPVPPLTSTPDHYSPLTYDFRVPSTEPWSLALIPTAHSWRVPLYLQFGGVNNSPYPVEHAALLRTWQYQYGVEIVCLTDDSFALTVTHLPHDTKTAWQLALDQVAYCHDLDQLVDVETLGKALLTSTAWFFWWD